MSREQFEELICRALPCANRNDGRFSVDHHGEYLSIGVWTAYQCYKQMLSEQAATESQGSDPWEPSDVDYDRAIHHNPDAKAWADFFVETFPGQADQHDLMIGWFANAMMAMYDYVKNKEAEPKPTVVGESIGTIHISNNGNSAQLFYKTSQTKLLAEGDHEVYVYPPKSLSESVPIDRPINCRNALRDAGKAYPKSGCQVCFNVLISGCPFERNNRKTIWDGPEAPDFTKP